MADAPLLFVTRKWPPAMGGMETYSAKLVEKLRKRRAVRLIALAGKPDGGVPTAAQLIGFGLTAAARILFGPSLPNLIHVGDMASWPFALLARMRKRSIRMILSAHGTDVAYGRRPGWRGSLYQSYLRLGARLLPRSQVIANSSATAEACRQAGFRSISIVPLASDFEPPDAPLDLSNNLLFAGRFVERKGLSWFVRNVLPLLPPDVALDVAGSPWSEEEADSLAEERVSHLGVLDPQRLAAAFAQALCVVVPNIEMANGEFEGFGLVAVEAAAAGGLVLAADIGGLRSAVIDGATGFLVEAGNAEAWAGKILEIRRWSDGARQAFVAGSIAESQAHFSWDRVARDTAAIYELDP